MTVEGCVLTESGLLAHAEVSVHRSYADLQYGFKPVASAKADKERLSVNRFSFPNRVTAKGVSSFIAEGASYHLKVRSNKGGGPPQIGLVIDGNKQDPLVKVSVSTGQTSEPVTLKTKIFPGRGRQQ